MACSMHRIYFAVILLSKCSSAHSSLTIMRSVEESTMVQMSEDLHVQRGLADGDTLVRSGLSP